MDERSNEDTFAPTEDTTYCRCCGGKADLDTFCMQCKHPYNDWCARGDGHCPNCGYMIDDEGKCGHCKHQRTRENTETARLTHCNYCGFMIGTDGVCMRKDSHMELPV